MGDRGERSLRLSQVGQQLARQALRARGWTQKTLTIGDRQIASWTTINKFFNGKPVDRLIFNEICECLNLDPQAVIELPEITPSAPIPVTLPSPSSSANSSTSTNPLFSQLRSHSHATREALTPRILQRISRGVVREKYLPAIQRGLTDDKIRVVGIVGPAGYGKSTILGDIYDQLMDNPEWGAKWVGLMLCANLLLPAELTTQTLELAMGQCLWGEPRSIVELARELTQQVGRGVILIDTLDLILKRPLVIALAPLLRSLVQNNINVVFTCRDREYQDLLEPTREKLSGLVANLDRHSLDVVISASHALVQVSGLLPTQILFLLESPFAGVRVNGLVVLAQLDVLTAMQRLDATFLSCCLERDGAALVACGWERNVAAILKAVQRVDGSMSDLFDRVQASDWCTEMLLSLIVGIRTRL